MCVAGFVAECLCTITPPARPRLRISSHATSFHAGCLGNRSVESPRLAITAPLEIALAHSRPCNDVVGDPPSSASSVRDTTLYRRSMLRLPTLHPELPFTRTKHMSTTRCCTKVFVTRFLFGAQQIKKHRERFRHAHSRWVSEPSHLCHHVCCRNTVLVYSWSAHKKNTQYAHGTVVVGIRRFFIHHHDV